MHPSKDYFRWICFGYCYRRCYYIVSYVIGEYDFKVQLYIRLTMKKRNIRLSNINEEETKVVITPIHLRAQNNAPLEY